MLDTVSISTKNIKENINKKFDNISKKVDNISNKIDKLNVHYIQKLTNENIDEILKSITDLEMKSVGYASLYYTYHILDLNGIKDFEYEFRTLENRLYRDFYYFSLVYAYSELMIPEFYIYNIKERTRIKFISEDGIVNEEYVEKLIEWSGCDPEFISDILKINVNIPNKIDGMSIRNLDSSSWEFSRFKSNIMYIENNFKWFSEPKYPLEQTIKILKLEHFNNYDKNLLIFTQSEYVLPIAKFVLNREIYTKTMWIDTAWSFAHNNFLLIESGEGLFYDELEKKDPTIEHRILLDILEDILHGKYNDTYKIAIIMNPKLKLYKYKSILEPLIIEELKTEALARSICENYIKTKGLREYTSEESYNVTTNDYYNKIIDMKCLLEIGDLYFKHKNEGK